MKFNFKMIHILGFFFLTLVSFQNCARTEFEAERSSLSDSSLNDANSEILEVNSAKLFGMGSSNYIYNYAPAVIEEAGTTYMWTCSNVPTPGKFTDAIGFFINGNYNGASISISPDKTLWDGFHACDPSVIKGDFKYNGEFYPYMMAYLGEDFNDANGDGKHTCDANLCEYSMHNQSGIALSKNITGPWVKVPGPLIPYANRYFWGIGQPSIIKLSDGSILIIYTKGDVNKTSVYYKRYDFSNFSDVLPAKVLTPETEVSIVGLTSKTKYIMLRNADFVLDPTSKTIYMLRGSEVNSPAYVQIAKMSLNNFLTKTGSWKVLKDIEQKDTGYKNNHNAGFKRTVDGHLLDPSKLSVYVTVENGVSTHPENPQVAWDFEILNLDLSTENGTTVPAPAPAPVPPPTPMPTPAPVPSSDTSSSMTIVAPVDASANNQTNPVIAWNYTGQANEFWLDLSEDPKFTWFWNHNEKVSVKSFHYFGKSWGAIGKVPYQAPAALTPGKTYYLRIVPFKDGAIISASTKTVSFKIASAAINAAAVSMIEPHKLFSQVPMIRWAYSGAVSNFWIDISEYPDFRWFWNHYSAGDVRSLSFASNKWGKIGSAPYAAPTVLQKNKTYYIRIVPFLDGKNLGTTGLGLTTSFVAL